MFYWRLEDVVSISECCMILHNLIVRLAQNDMLDGEEFTGELDIVREFGGEVKNIHPDGDTSTAAGNNGDYLHLHMETLHVTEEAMKSEYEHWRLRDDLIHVHRV